MNILFVGGFLGSGKTTVINRIIRSMTAQGLHAAIVENEIGEISVDQEILSGGGAKITALSGGCVCCELFGDLLTAIEDVHRQIDPDWLIIETTGLAMLDSIRNNYETYGSAQIPFYMLAVADCARFDLLWPVMKPLLKGQLASADIVLLSKTDVCAPSEQLRGVLSEIAPEAAVLDAGSAGEAELWPALETLLKGIPAHAGAR